MSKSRRLLSLILICSIVITCVSGGVLGALAADGFALIASGTPQSDVLLSGTFNNWEGTSMNISESGEASLTVDLDAGSHSFNIKCGDMVYGHSGTIKDTTITTATTGWNMTSGANVACTLLATGGSYTFKFIEDTCKLWVYHGDVVDIPESDTDVLVVNTSEGTQTATVGDTLTYEMKLSAEELFEDIQIAVSYDDAKLQLVRPEATEDEPALNCPNLQDVYYNADNPGVVSLNASDIEGYDFTNETLLFKLDFLVIDGGETTVDMTIQEFTAVGAQTPYYTYSQKVLEEGYSVSETMTVKAGTPEPTTTESVTESTAATETTEATEVTTEATEPVTTTTDDSVPTDTEFGKLRVNVLGGSGFKISINGGAARPQGTMYRNTKMPIGAEVTLVANSSAGSEFLGWANEFGAIVSQSETYTLTSTGNDYFEAMYITSVEGVNLVTFKNAKAANGNGQIIDMQYYAAGDEIGVPDAPTQAGYIFTGWDKTAEQITVAIANGEDVTVQASWEVKKVYVAVNVTNGAVTANGGEENGKYLANRAVTVTADAAPSSKKFAYWTNENGSIKSYDAEYKFYPAVDTTLIAVYVAEDEEIVYQALADIAADPSIDGEKISYTLSWNVPASVGTYKSSGLMVVNKEDFNADTFYHGTTDTKVFDRALSGTALKPQNTYSINKSSSYYDNTYVAATWVQYEVNGELVTIYSDFVEVTKLG